MIKQEILILLSSIFILVIAWIGFNIYHSSTTSTITPREMNQIIPMNPKFNAKVINDLKQREKVDPTYENVTDSPLPSPTTTISPASLFSTSSAKASSGGTLR